MVDVAHQSKCTSGSPDNVSRGVSRFQLTQFILVSKVLIPEIFAPTFAATGMHHYTIMRRATRGALVPWIPAAPAASAPAGLKSSLPALATGTRSQKVAHLLPHAAIACQADAAQQKQRYDGHGKKRYRVQLRQECSCLIFFCCHLWDPVQLCWKEKE
jgi:hypothetical protein